MWSLVEKYSIRVHNLDKFSIITPEEKRQRHPMNWDGYEMENGVTIVADQYNVTVEILDTKLVVANSDKKRDWNLHGSYFYRRHSVLRATGNRISNGFSRCGSLFSGLCLC